jgi:hypothetical protein
MGISFQSLTCSPFVVIFQSHMSPYNCAILRVEIYNLRTNHSLCDKSDTHTHTHICMCMHTNKTYYKQGSVFMILCVVTSTKYSCVLYRHKLGVGDINYHSSTSVLQCGSEIGEPGRELPDTKTWFT